MTQQIRKGLQELGRTGAISASASHPPLLKLQLGKPTSPVSPAPLKGCKYNILFRPIGMKLFLPDHGAESGSAQTQI